MRIHLRIQSRATSSTTLRALLPACALFACGPNTRGIVESDMRFEHCYRIDEDARVAVDDKRTCWNDWSSHYSREQQDSSRVRYAAERRADLDGAAHPATTPTVATTATPLSAYVPPVATEAPKLPRSSAELPLRDPAACRADCLHAFGACLALCVPGTDGAPLCSTSRRKCERACE